MCAAIDCNAIAHSDYKIAGGVRLYADLRFKIAGSVRLEADFDSSRRQRAPKPRPMPPIRLNVSVCVYPTAAPSRGGSAPSAHVSSPCARTIAFASSSTVPCGRSSDNGLPETPVIGYGYPTSRAMR